MMTASHLPRPLAQIEDLVTATRILINETVLDVFGHVAVRDPVSPDIFWMGAAGAPTRIMPDDVMPFDLNGNPLGSPDVPLFSERFLHAALFKAREDLHASCHHHAEALMPYCLGAATLGATSQTGGWMGVRVPLWDSRERFGDTSMLVTNMAQSEDLIAALGQGTIILLRGHGTLVAGSDIRDLTFRAVHSCREARTDTLARGLGPVTVLSAGEIALCSSIAPAAISRSWEHWKARLPAYPHKTTTKGIPQ